MNTILSSFFRGACCLVLLSSLTVVTLAATRNVSKSGADTGDCIASPCLTIGYAVGQAVSGDTVSVATGMYAEAVSVTKQLTLISNGATIDATGLDNGILITGSAAAGTVVHGFNVRNATLEGILAVATGNLTIESNRVENNDQGFFFQNPPPACAGFSDCGEGVHLLSVVDSNVQDNLINDNVGGILLTDEEGPTRGNRISENTVTNNAFDCGITLASHYFSRSAPAPPDLGGVYDNQIIHNTSNGNGAAGIGIFAGPPGAAAYRNNVIGNTARNNGLPGVAIHSHLFAQYVNDNVIVNNELSENGEDDDAQTGGDTGISIFSDASGGAAPIERTVVSANRISDEVFGVYIVHAVKVSGLPSTKFTNVTTPTFLVP